MAKFETLRHAIVTEYMCGPRREGVRRVGNGATDMLLVVAVVGNALALAVDVATAVDANFEEFCGKVKAIQHPTVLRSTHM